jgi:hypothetical protein
MAADPSGRTAVLKRCHQCGGKFGLVRYYYLRHPFCSRRCLERYKTPLAAEVSRRKTLSGWPQRS